MEGYLEPVISPDFTPLTDSEIADFFHDLDRDRDGSVTFAELEEKLHEVHDELAPELLRHHLLHPARRDAEKQQGHHPHRGAARADGLHAFLCSLMPECGVELSEADFTRQVRTWGVPSQKQSDSTEAEQEDRDAGRRLPLRRRARAYWAVHGPNLLFVACVVACVLAFSIWQGVIYVVNQPARRAFGWGVIVAKFSAGAVYPTFMFMLLSMSRHLATFLRRSYWVSRFVNWDLSQKFHVIMSCAGLVFATLHAVGHLAGTLVFASSPARQDRVAEYTGLQTPRSYSSYLRTLPGWSGAVSLGLFWTIGLMSMPLVRNWSYEAFQLAHLPMFPLVGLLCAHGTAALLQAPMLGYFLAFPALLVILERTRRFAKGFMSIPARLKVLDEAAMSVTIKQPQGRDWTYNAGQYVLLQVPQISLFQWHPFTISSCRGDEMQVHIKAEGDWTEQLRDLGLEDSGGTIQVAIDGPFGAPAQRFYDYDCSIIIGGGIGITPFSAILTDLEENFRDDRNPWEDRRHSDPCRPASAARGQDSRPSSQLSTPVKDDDDEDIQPERTAPPPRRRLVNPRRRVDFHWTVREKNNLLWFSDLLNRAIVGAGPLAERNQLDLHIHTHITAKRKAISTHVFRYVLDGYRTGTAPYSALTGLKQRSHFGRPDFDAILQRHFQDLVDDGVREKKVGVFYCGTPVVGEIVSDACHQLTVQARDMGLRIRYEFLMEVFG